MRGWLVQIMTPLSVKQGRGSHMICTTLNRIREHRPCQYRWPMLLAGLGKTSADDEPLPYARIVEICGIDDALWACRAEPQYEKEWRLFAIWCARQVEHLMKDERSRAALDASERFANGEATADELDAARVAAWAAACDAAMAANYAEWNATRAVAMAANYTAWNAAWAAACAARAAARSDPSAAASAAARKAQTKKFLEIVGER